MYEQNLKNRWGKEKNENIATTGVVYFEKKNRFYTFKL